MTFDEFVSKIKSINGSLYSYGNEILYNMCKTPADLDDPQKLSGAIWLIGRAYAASPQRRSYGKTKTSEEYINFDRKSVRRPIWPVRTQNDGREGFFDYISKNLDRSCFEDIMKSQKNPTTFSYTVRINNEGTANTKSYQISDQDKTLLTGAISAVLKFNENLSNAIEMFDGVPDSKKFKDEDVKCNNHISFASKFLHFYFPNTVFIIDSFSYDGGGALLNAIDKNGNILPRYIIDPPTDNNCFDSNVYDELKKAGFCQDAVKAITQDIIETLYPTNKSEKYLKNNDNAVKGDDSIEGKHYITHCVRSYLMGAFLKKNSVSPINCINGAPSLCSMPRLIDAVFLNIKRPLTEKEKKYQESLDDTFYNAKSSL